MESAYADQKFSHISSLVRLHCWIRLLLVPLPLDVYFFIPVWHVWINEDFKGELNSPLVLNGKNSSDCSSIHKLIALG